MDSKPFWLKPFWLTPVSHSINLDGNKQLSARGGGSTDQVGVTVGRSHSNSKRTETSSMSSSVLADFSSGMNEVGSIRSNSPSQSSLSSNGGNDMDQDLNKCGTTPVDKADETHLSDAAVLTA